MDKKMKNNMENNMDEKMENNLVGNLPIEFDEKTEIKMRELLDEKMDIRLKHTVTLNYNKRDYEFKDVVFDLKNVPVAGLLHYYIDKYTIQRVRPMLRKRIDNGHADSLDLKLVQCDVPNIERKKTIQQKIVSKLNTPTDMKKLIKIHADELGISVDEYMAMINNNDNE